MKFIRRLIQRPVAVVMLFTAITLLGVFMAIRIPVTPLPNVHIPEITININKQSTLAQDLDQTVVAKIRAYLSQVIEIKEMYSETHDNGSIIHLRFKYGADIDYIFNQVNEKVDLAMNRLPKDVDRPRVIKASSIEIPVFTISVRQKQSSVKDDPEKFIDLSDFSTQILKRRLEQLPEIAMADITGTVTSQIVITPNSVAIHALGLNEENFKKILASNELFYGNISVRYGELRYNIRFDPERPKDLEDIKNIHLNYDGRLFKLSDIAQVRLAFRPAQGLFLAGLRPAIGLSIIKQPTAKLSDLRKHVDGLLEEFRKNYPDLIFEKNRDQTGLLEYSINNLEQDLFIGGFIAFVMMFLFLGDRRSPFLVAITVPVCLVISLLLFKLLGISINIISLSGLVLGVGLMIDNSIIVIDNISQYSHRGYQLIDACAEGTSEVMMPLLASSMTTCSVFLPLIFLSGISGALFYDQAMAITAGLATSFVVSVTLLPTLFHILHRNKKSTITIPIIEKHSVGLLERVYKAGFNIVFANKKISVIVVIGMIIGNIWLFWNLKKEKLPFFEQSELEVRVDWQKNIDIVESADRLKAAIKELGSKVVMSTIQIGKQDYLLNKDEDLSMSEAVAYLKVNDVRQINEMSVRLKTMFSKKYPGALIDIRPPLSVFERIFGQEGSELIVKVYKGGLDDVKIIAKVDLLADSLNTYSSVQSVNLPPVQHALVLRAYPERLISYSFSVDDVYQRLYSSFNPKEISVLKNGDQSLPIMLSDDLNDLEKVINNATLTAKDGSTVNLAHFVSIYSENTYKTIYADKGGQYVPLSIDTDDPEAVLSIIDELRVKYRMDMNVTGGYFANKELIGEMAVVMIVAILILYFILASQFGSLVQPVIVLLELPISMSGALIMLYIFGASINLVSLIGLVVMCGIIINDSILKIDTINKLRRNNQHTLIDAIHIAGAKRLKAIFMTAMTTMLSVAPFLIGSDMGSLLQRPLSLALVGGLIIGTPVSLYFIPLLYWYYYKNSKT
jgi:multidrug efflux pump subunit AcrB